MRLLGAVAAILAAIAGVVFALFKKFRAERNGGRVEGFARGVEEERKAEAAELVRLREERAELDEERAALDDAFDNETTQIDLRVRHELEEPAPDSVEAAEQQARKLLLEARARYRKIERDVPTQKVKR